MTIEQIIEYIDMRINELNPNNTSRAITDIWISKELAELKKKILSN